MQKGKLKGGQGQEKMGASLLSESILCGLMQQVRGKTQREEMQNTLSIDSARGNAERPENTAPLDKPEEER